LRLDSDTESVPAQTTKRLGGQLVRFLGANPDQELKEKMDSDEAFAESRKKGSRKKGSKKRHKGQKRSAEEREHRAPVTFDPSHKRKATSDATTPTQALSKLRSPYVEGIVKRHPDGFGFVIPDQIGLPDIYIPRHHMMGVMTNDRVKVEVYSTRQADRVFGEIKQILNRAHTRVVGQFLPVDRRYGLILGEGKGWGFDLKISTENSMGAKEGDLVAVEILTYPTETTDFTGQVVSLIGDLDEPLNDIKRVIFSQGIPHEFSDRAVQDARKFGGQVTDKDRQGRRDLRDLPLITIDGATARDFDDAICVQKGNDGFKLWVAIADVSHYVRPGTALDDEAFARGTSTYFPNYVVPMLPEELSNDLCSLNPNVDRLCFVCEMDIDFQGHISSFEFYEAVMKSQARVIYGEAQEVIDGEVPKKLRHVAENILNAADLAKLLMIKRYREGSLDLEIPETQVVVDESGETVDIIKSERLFAHRLIEELMLAANICAARFLDENHVAGIYRIHEEPFEENIQNLQRFLFNFGGQGSMSGGKLQKKLTRALKSFEGKPEAQILNILALRAMQQAKYSHENVGHFGLGFSHYTHFTSPIRRYPDLIAHRQIKSVIYPAYRRYQMTEDDLASASTMLSAHEQRSVKAERQVISIKKARFVSRFIGEEFDGVISSVAKFGVFVMLRAYDVDGLVKTEELGDDRFIFDEQNLRLVGKRNGFAYGLGDIVRVQVVAADTELGKIEFRLAQSFRDEQSEGLEKNQLSETKHASSGHSKTNRKNDQERRKAKDNRRRLRKERISKRRRKA